MRFKNIIFLMLTLTFSISCTKDLEQFDIAKEGKMNVHLFSRKLLLPQELGKVNAQVTAAEDQIDEVSVIIFDENNLYLNTQEVDVNDQISVVYTNDQRTVFVIANANSEIRLESKNWTSELTTIDEVMNALVETSGNSIPSPSFTMYKELVYANGFNLSSDISEDGIDGNGKADPLLLDRNVAKIQLYISNILDNKFDTKFALLEYRLINTPSDSYIIQDLPLVDSDFGNLINSDIINAADAVYSYSANSSVTLIAKIEDLSDNSVKYYRVPIYDPTTNVLGVKQNYLYNIGITSIDTAVGYDTESEAIAGSSGLVPSIEIEENDIRDFIYQDSDVLGLSNNAFYYLGDNGSTSHEMFQLQFSTLNPSMNSTNMELLTPITGDISDINISSDYNVSTATNGLLITVDVSFGSNAVEGYIRVSFGDIIKDVYYYYDPAGIEDNNPKGRTIKITDTKVAQIISSTGDDLEWISLKDKGSVYYDYIVNSRAQDEVLIYDTFTPSSTTRTAIVLFHRSGTYAGTTKLIAEKN